MAAKGKGAKAGMKMTKAMPGKRSGVRLGAKAGARTAKRNPYLQELIQNERVRERLRTGVSSTRAAYARISRRGKGAEDRKFRRELTRAIASFQEAAATVRGAKKKRRRRIGAQTLVPVLAVGGVGALAANKGLRQKVVGLASGSSNTSHAPGGSAYEGDSAAAAQSSPAESTAPGESNPPTASEG